MKICKACGLPKDDTEFDVSPIRHLACPRCQSCVKRSRVVGSLAWQARNPEKVKSDAYRGRYGIDFDAIWQEQEGLCALCHEPLLRTGIEPLSVAVDHDRACCPGPKSCGKCVRGLIHRRCNLLLGYAEDDTDNLEGLRGYLEKWAKSTERGGVL